MTANEDKDEKGRCKIKANALQLEAARATPLTPALFRFNYDAMPSLKSLNLSIAVS